MLEFFQLLYQGFLFLAWSSLLFPLVGDITGMAKVLWAVILLLLYRAELHIFLTRLLYSFVTLFLLRGPLKLIDSSWPRYVCIHVYTSLHVQVLLLSVRLFLYFFLNFPFSVFYVYIYAHFVSPKVIPTSLENVVMILSKSFASS